MNLPQIGCAVFACAVLTFTAHAQDFTSPRLVRIIAQGGEIAPAFTFARDVLPVAFCLANDGRVLAADDSAAQQIRIFAVKSGSLAEVARFGERGGIASGTPGAFGDRKLNHITALGTDANDNLYVAHDAQSGGGGTVLESYKLESRLQPGPVPDSLKAELQRVPAGGSSA